MKSLRLLLPTCVFFMTAPAIAADLKAAAGLTGMVAGMASECGLNAAPVYAEMKSLMDRTNASQAERRSLGDAATAAAGLGASTQRKARSCSHVQGELDRAVATLRRAQ